MSKLTEYLKLLPAGLKNLDKVVEGFKNQLKMELGTLPPEEEEIIVGRRLICSQCPFMSTNAVKLGVYATDREDEHCTQCGCPLSTRTASLESECGLAAHNKRHPESPIPLRWHKVK